MTLSDTRKLAKHVCALLKVPDITFPIGRTAKGNLGLVFSDKEDFDIMLDSVPLSTKNVLQDENNIQLKAMIEKYLFDSKPDTIPFIPTTAPALPKARGGRPKGSKNKK